MASGGKKDAPYIAGLFEPIIEDFDPKKCLTDLILFDGASNVQKAGQILEAKFPTAHCLHGGEHVVSLFFADCAKIKEIKVSLTSTIIIHVYCCALPITNSMHCFVIVPHS